MARAAVVVVVVEGGPGAGGVVRGREGGWTEGKAKSG